MTDYRIVVLEVACRGLWAEALLNGAPIVRVADGAQKQIQMKGNPWVVEGPNWLQARLGFPRGQDGLGPGAEFRLRAFEIEHGNPQAQEHVLAEYLWEPADQPVDAPGLHMVLEQQIQPTQSHGRWSWEDAQPYEPSDRADVERLAVEVHQALAQRDRAAMASLLALKYEELARGLDVPAQELQQDSDDALREAFGEDDFQAVPLEPSTLSVEPTALGRLVNVFDAEGGAPIRAAAFGDVMQVEMTVSHLAQGWTIVR